MIRYRRISSLWSLVTWMLVLLMVEPQTRLVGQESSTYIRALEVILAPSPTKLAASSILLLTAASDPGRPTLAPITNQTINVGQRLSVTVKATDRDVPTQTLQFSLLEKPVGATVRTIRGTNAVIGWTPTRDSADTTNRFTVVVSDNGTPSLSATQSFQVIVTDFAQSALGTTVIQAGQDGCLPLTIDSSETITNIEMTIRWPLGTFTNFTVTATAPQICSATLQSVSPTQAVVRLFTCPGQSLTLTQAVDLADLCFTALPGQPSAFVPLIITNSTVRTLAGNQITNRAALAGTVVVVGSDPLLEITRTADQGRQLFLYANPGRFYQIDSTTNLSNPAAWQLACRVPMTGPALVLCCVDLTGSTKFFRARELGAGPTNEPPRVDAGPDQIISTNTTTLHGSATDDGLPAGCKPLTYAWSRISGPGPATFSNPTSAVTTVSFSARGTYVFRLSASDTQSTNSDDVTISAPSFNCSLAEEEGWLARVSSPHPPASAGSVLFNNCTIVLNEGGSFEVTAEKTFVIPTTPSMLVLTYETPTFDSTSTGLMRDAFEVALVDTAGRPLTFTIQGEAGLTPASVLSPAVLPPSPDALFNHTDGKPPFVARGSAVTPTIGGARQLSMDVSHLVPGTAAKLILRLVNNDRDRVSSVRIVDVSFQSAPPSQTPPGSPGTALSLLGPATAALGNSNSANPCPPPPLRFQTSGAATQGTSLTCLSPPSDLVAWWPGDGNAFDIASARPSTKLGGFGYETGKISDAFNFDGVNDYIDLGEPADLQITTSDYTIAGWIMIAATPNNSSSQCAARYPVFGFGWGYNVSILNNRQIQFYQYYDNSSSASLISHQSISTNTFHHVAAVRSQSEMRLYIDGALDSSRAFTNESVYFQPGDTLKIGAMDCGSSRFFFKGRIDELTVFKRALSSNEITAIYEAGANGICKFPSQFPGQTNSPTLVFYPNDARSWQGATVGTFAELFYGANTPATRQLVVDRQLLDAGLFSLSNTFPAVLLPTQWTSGNIERGRSLDSIGSGGYEYEHVESLFTVSTTANAIDDLWFQSATNVGETVFDLGAPSAKAAVFPTIDHGPLPQEAIESTVYLSIDRVNWTPAVVQRVWLEGWHPNLGIKWDGFVYAVGTSNNALFRYASTTWGGPGALQPLYGTDDEINGVVGLTEDYFPVQRIVPSSPALTITAPTDNAQFGHGAALLTGYTIADRPDIFGILATNSVLLVTVNGTPVDALDTAGNFFSSIDVQPGQNVFEVAATDAFNQSTTNTVTVYGTTCPQNFVSLGEVSASVVPDYGRTSFNEWTKVLYADLALRNAGTYPIRAPFYVGVTRISDPSVKLLAPDGVSADGIPYYDYSATLTTESLITGSLTAARTLAFHNPNKVQFTYDLVVLGQLNQAPAFTTTPTLEAIAAKPYTYAFNATDPDGDALTYTLTTGPAGLTLNSQLQTLNWSPLATNLGTHDIRLRADDGKGGIAEQHYLLSVINQPSNRPPYFVSTPVVTTRVAVEEGKDCLPTSGLIARWEADGNAIDAVGGHNGVLLPGTGFSNGICGEAFSLDAIEAGIDLGDIPEADFASNDSFTFAAWVKFLGPTPRTSSSQCILTMNYRCGPTFQGLGVLNDGTDVGKAYVSLRDEVWQSAIAKASQPLSTNEFHLIVGVRDVASGGKFLRCYVDGQLTDQVLDPTTGKLANTGHDFIGRRFPCPDSCSFNGLIDAVLIYKRALSEGEIVAMYEYGNRGCRCLPTPTYSYDADARDPDSDPLTYSLLVAPTNMTINPVTGLIRWSPEPSDTTQTFGSLPIGFFDGEFSDGDWSVSKFVDTTPATDGLVLGERQLTDGAPGAFRAFSHDWTGPGGVTFAHVHSRTTYDPLVLGPIDSVEFQWDVNVFDSSVSAAVAVSPLIIQNGKLFLFLSTATANAWTHFDFGKMGATNFVASDGSFPDFSATASPLQFGFASGNGTSGNQHVVTRAGIDNWRVTVTPAQDLPAGMVPVVVKSTDNRGGVTYQSYRICVLPAEGNRAPIITTEPSTSIVSNQAYSYQVEAVDPDNDRLTYVLNQGPHGMTINATNGLLRWEPDSGLLTTNRISFFDGFFDSADWRREVYTGGGGGGGISTLETSGGNPGDFQRIRLTVNGAAVPTDSPSIFHIFFKSSAVYSPRNSRAILSIDYSEDAIQFSSGDAQQGQYGGVALKQNGRIFIRGWNLSKFQTTWTNITMSALDESSFTLFSLPGDQLETDPRTRLDFSTNGTAIEFGFYRMWGNCSGCPGWSAEGGIDNWSFGLRLAPTFPITVTTSDGKGGEADQSFDVTLTRPAEIHGSVFEDLDKDENWDRGPDLLVAAGSLWRFEPLQSAIVSKSLDYDLIAVTVGPNGDSYGLNGKGQVLRFQALTDKFLGVFSSGFYPRLLWDLDFGPDGDLYVTEHTTDSVLKFDGRDGHFINTFASGGSLDLPWDLSFGPDGSLYVASALRSTVVRFDINSGMSLGEFTPRNTSLDVTGLGFGPDGNLYATSWHENKVMKYDGRTGAYLGVFVPPLSGGLRLADTLIFGPDGTLYVAGILSHSVLAYDGLTGVFQRTVFEGRESFQPSGLAFSRTNFTGTVEGTLEGRIIYLDQNRDGRRNSGESFTTTDSKGQFAFTNLSASKYYVRLEQQNGWIQTSPAQHQHVLVLTNGQVEYNVDFGAVVRPGNLPNQTPRFIQSPPSTGTVNSPFVYDAEAIDSDGDSLAFDLITHPEGMLVETNSGVVAWRPLLSQLGTHEVILRVQDGRGGVALQSWQITVTAPNSPPFITTFPPGPAVVGLPYRYAIRAQDPESQPLTFALTTNAPAGLTLTNLVVGTRSTASDTNSVTDGVESVPTFSRALISWTPALAQLGTNLVEIIVSDSEGAEARQSFGLEVLVSAPNRPPAITSTPRTQTRVGSPYAYVVEVNDPDGDPVAVTLLSSPSGMVVTNLPVTDGAESLPTIYWPGAELGSYTVLLRASDGRSGTADQQFTLNVASSLNNQPPLITSLPLEHATAGQTYDYQLTASDPDGDAVTWRVLTGPVGVSLDSATGRLLWIPTLGQMGTNAVVIKATDTLLATATQTFSIEVGCLNRPPQITSVPPTAAQTGDPYLYAPRGNDPDGDRLSWSLVPGQFPPGMTIDGTNGLVRWTPTTNQVGGTIVSVRVTDGRGGNDTQTFTLYAANLRANHAPVIVTIPPRGATVGRPYSYNLRATDSDGDTLTIQSLLSLPAGASFTPSPGGEGRGEGGLVWTPQLGQQGQQEFILTARDPAGASASQRFFVTVRSNLAPAIVSAPRTNAVPGVTYRYDVSAFDPDGDALTYVLAAPVPSGLVIDNLGRISWTPSFAQTGVFPITVTASDSFGASTTQAFNLFVTADTEPPVVSLAVGYNLNDAAGNRFVQIGTEVPVRVEVSDNVGVASRELRVAGQVIPLSASGGASVLFPTSGQIPAIAQATDFSGNVAFTTNLVQVVDPNAASTVAIVIHSPTNTTEVTRSVPVIATITSQVPLFDYQVDFAPIDSDMQTMELSMDDPSLVFQTITNVTLPPNTFGLTNVTVGRFDPLMLLNGAYVIRVSAFDQNRQGQREGVIVNVAGNLKFGEFRLEFTDLTIPVAGIPITVKRVYDTRESRRQGDFGHGWSLGVQDARILEIGKRPFYGLDDEGTTFTTRTRVYMTTPDGRRVGFNFTPQFAGGSFAFGAFFRPAFTADPGVYDRLEVVPALAGYQVESDGSVFTGFGLVGLDPATYRLTTRDNLVYDYDQRAGLKSVRDPNGNQLLYTRDGIFHYSAGATDADQSIRFVRDAQGRIAQIIDPTGKILRYTYDAAGDLRAFADQVTNVTQYAYSQARAHFLTNIIDPLGRSALRMDYDASGRLTGVRDANGNPITQDFNTDSNTGTYQDGNGNVTVVKYDDQGNETVRMLPGISTNYFAFDANNNLLASTNGRGFSTNFTYDARGNVTSITDSLSNRTTIAYSAQNKPVGVINALGQVISLAYNSSGQLTQVVNNAGFKTSVSRDGMGRVASLTDATGTNTTIFDYNGGCACGKPGKVINPDGSFKLTEYNSLGQVTREVNELGAEKLSFFDDTGKLLWTRDPLTNYTQFFYRGPLLTNVVDALGRSTRYEYDSLNRTNKIIDAENGVVEFRYDNNGNRTHVIDAVTNVTTFVYDSANRLKMQIDPLGHTNFFGYDTAGNRTEAIDRNGRKRTFAYDAANRMTNELWWEGTNAVRSIVFGFNELGVQTLAADPAARYTYSYDSLNRLERVLSQSAGVPDFTLLYTYTKLGQIESVEDNYGVRVGSGYDNRNRLSQRTWQGPGVDTARVNFAYDVSGNRTRTDRFADLAGANRIGFTTNAHNHAGIVTNITHAGPTGTVLAKYDYHFDAAYQIRNWTINNQPSAFEYDRTGQLTNALNTAQPNENFRFDANGNRVGAQSGGSYVVGRNNQILSDGTNRYAYDLEGNMTVRSNTVNGVLTTYQWDHRNRLMNVLDRNPVGVVTQTVAFVYDAMNRRLSKTVNAPQTTNVVRFLYNQDDSWADLDGTNAVIARYLHGARIDELLARQRASDGRGWYLTDHLGTVRDLANAAGAVVAHVDYSSFGQVLGVSNLGAVDRFLFTGRELDGETGLYFYRARYYSAPLGRFVCEDPIGFGGNDYQLYRYVSNSSLSKIDPSGRSAFTEYVSLNIGLILTGTGGALLGVAYLQLCEQILPLGFPGYSRTMYVLAAGAGASGALASSLWLALAIQSGEVMVSLSVAAYRFLPQFGFGPMGLNGPDGLAFSCYALFVFDQEVLGSSN